MSVSIKTDKSYYIAEKYFGDVGELEQNRFLLAAKATFDTMIKIEPGLTHPKNDNDILFVRLATDAEGRAGDVRDVIFSRPLSKWEIGISAKNNNEDAKHSRLGPRKRNPNLDWGLNWFGMQTTEDFWRDFNPVLERVDSYKREGITLWSKLPSEIIEDEFYTPTLEAFKGELLRQSKLNKDLPLRLTSFFIGNRSFYKIVKVDNKNIVIVRAFNYNGELNKTVNKGRPLFKVPGIEYPTKIVYFDYPEEKDGMKNSLELILDKGWSINLRIHTGDGPILRSFKFVVTLTGNPPVLFSQFLFQE